MTRIQVTDLFALTARTITPEGYLVAPATLARTGVQDYLAKELGLDKTSGMAAGQRVRLHRPAEEVFSQESMATFDHKPVTFKHPPELVTADTWKKYGVGEVHSVRANGNVMAAEMIVRDKAAVQAVIDGTSKLSNGYAFDLDMTPGMTPDGAAYDGVQRNIVGNHIAIVDNPRGGHACRIGDDTTNHPSRGDRTMALKRVKIGFDSKPVTLELEDAQADLVVMLDEGYKEAVRLATDATAKETAKVVALTAELVGEKEKNTKLATDHATAVAELSKQIKKPEDIEALATARATAITDAQVEALAAERATVVDSALHLVPKFEHAKKTVAQIRTDVISAIVAGDDESLKAIALAGLCGVDAVKAEPAVSKIVFATVSAAKTRTVADDSHRAEVLDATGKALAGVKATKGGETVQPLSGRDLFMYRETHNGRAPGEAKS